MADWFTNDTPEEQERLFEAWGDSSAIPDEVLGMILEVARTQVVAYGYGLPDNILPVDLSPSWITPVPTHYVYAQLQQAINLWNAGRVTSAGDVGLDGYTFTPRPLDKTIRGIIRPLDLTNVF